MAHADETSGAVVPYRWVIIGALVLCPTALVWYGFTIGVLLPDISDDLGLRPAEEGWLSSAFYFGQLVLTLPVTAWLARYQPLRTMGLVFVLTAVLLAAAAVIPWYWGQVGIRFALAFAFVALNPVRTLIVSGWFHRGEIPRVMSLFNSGFGVIQTVAFWSSGALLSILGGWRPVLWMLAGLAVVGVAAWVAVARGAPPPAASLHGIDGAGSGGGSMGRVLRSRPVWLLCLIGIGGALTWSSYLTFWASFAQDDMGLSENVTGIVLGCSAFAIIPGSLMAVWVLRMFGSRRLFLVVITLSQVPLFGLWAVIDNPAALVAIGLLQGASWMYFPIMLSIPFDIEGFDASDVALASGMFFVANALALTAGPALSGVAAEWVNMRTVLLVNALFPLVSVLGALLLADARTPSTDVSSSEAPALAPTSS
jgi:predicted MFS family arabinose efflux permease